MDNVDYETRVQKYEQEGCTRSDAQGIVDAEYLTMQKYCKHCLYLYDNEKDGDWACDLRPNLKCIDQYVKCIESEL